MTRVTPPVERAALEMREYDREGRAVRRAAGGSWL